MDAEPEYEMQEKYLVLGRVCQHEEYTLLNSFVDLHFHT
jgi:hypothetical protein